MPLVKKVKMDKIYITPFSNKHMTIIVGILCEDGLVIASDSQAMSQRGVDVKRMDYTKIEDIDGELGVKALISGSGVVSFINKAMELLREKCNEKRIKSVKELILCAEDTMDDLTKRYSVDKFKKMGIAKNIKSKYGKELQDEGIPFPTLNFHLMIGCVEKNIPHLYTISPTGIAEKEEKFGSLGSGSAYAEYILTNLYYEGIKLKEGLLLAIHTVEEVKKIDPNVGGDVQIATIDKKGNIQKGVKLEVNGIVKDITEKNNVLSKVWRSLLIGEKTPEEIKGFLKKR